MAATSLFPGFDGLITLSRREGVDVRPTLLRVLTDLYVQTSRHSEDEARQFVELTSRLIDQVDDATRAAVRARLAVYPGTPIEVSLKLGLNPFRAAEPATGGFAAPSPPPSAIAPVKPPSETPLRVASSLAMQPKDAAEINDMFSRASAGERALILHNLQSTPLKASARIDAARAARAIEALEMAAFAADVENFTLELGEALILPSRVAAQVVDDPSGEPLACACRALEMPGPVFLRVLLFLKSDIGTSVPIVYRLSRLYDRLSERSALIMLAAWRGSTIATTRARYRPSLYDDERHRVRPAAAETRPALPDTGTIRRAGSQG
jgi:hypothetical protein